MDNRNRSWLDDQEQEHTRYLNTILLIGYGGFFALWATTHQKIDQFWFGLIGAMILISLGVFLLWEVAKAFAFGHAGNECRKKDMNGHLVHSPHEYSAIFQRNYDKINRFWGVQFLISASLGFLALCLLLWQYIVVMYS